MAGTAPLGRRGEQPADWGRLIPGEIPAFFGQKKPDQMKLGKKIPQSVPLREPPGDAASAIFLHEPPRQTTLGLLLPRPLQSRTAWKWLRSTAIDCALVGVNWLLIAAAYAFLHALLPDSLWFVSAAAPPASLPGIAMLHGALITLMNYTEGLHRSGSDLRQQARILGKSVLWATVVLCSAYSLRGASLAMCSWFLAAGALHFGTLWAWRWQGRKWWRRGGTSRDLRNVLIVGAGGVGKRIASYIESHPETGRAVCGLLEKDRPTNDRPTNDRPTNDRPTGDRVIGRVRDLARLARTGFVDEVMLAEPQDRAVTLQVLREARRLRLDVGIVPELFGCSPAGSELEQVGEIPVISLYAERSPTAALVTKRLIDITASGLALILLSPLLALIAALIKLDSPGPVLYCALRAGRKARPFRCCKFRTMVRDADALKTRLQHDNRRLGPFFKIPDDPRITRLGRFLRRYSLDELPQLWNVLTGDMSLVGPRPHPLDDFAAYEVEHLARLDMTPGMTGLWQVMARRDPSFARGMELDREYIRTWSLTSDLRILWKTVWAVARGSGD